MGCILLVMRMESRYRSGDHQAAGYKPACARRMGLSRGPLGGLVMGVLAIVYLGAVAVAAPIHMLDVGATGEPATAAGHTGTLDTGHSHTSHTGDFPEAPHEHGADCLTCGLLTLPGTQAFASVSFQIPGLANTVFSPRGLAPSDRAVVNPRLRGPPVT